MPSLEDQRSLIDLIVKAHSAGGMAWTDTPLGPVAELTNFTVLLRRNNPAAIVITVRKKSGEQIDNFALGSHDPIFAALDSVYNEASSATLEKENKTMQQLFEELRGRAANQSQKSG